MKRMRIFTAYVLVLLATLAIAVWVASYFWTPQLKGPWPASALEQTRDYGFVVLTSGRVFIVRQRVEVAQATPSSPPPPASVQSPSLELRDGTIDVSRLGMMSIYAGALEDPTSQRMAMISVGSIEQSLAQRPWWRGGFSSGVVSAPRVMVNDVIATARISAASIPLWIFIPLGLPAALVLRRDLRIRRWAAEGRCLACGYDLRESPQRCPECGRTVPVARAA